LGKNTSMQPRKQTANQMSDRAYVGPADIERLDRSAILHRTSCGEGELVWRQWGKGPVLILVHGGFGCWKHWARNIGELSKSFTVYAVDLPGLGDSDPAPDASSAQGVASVLEQGIDVLFKKDEPIYIGAFSLGAAISASLIRSLGDRVRHALLIGASGIGLMWYPAIEKLARRSSKMSVEEQREVIRQNLAVSMIADRGLIDEDTISLQFDMLAQKRRLIGLPISQSNIVLECLSTIGKRTTFVWGEFDLYLKPDLNAVIKDLNSRVSGLDIRTIKGAGHWANFEADEVVSNMLLDMP